MSSEELHSVEIIGRLSARKNNVILFLFDDYGLSPLLVFKMNDDLIAMPIFASLRQSPYLYRHRVDTCGGDMLVSLVTASDI